MKINARDGEIDEEVISEPQEREQEEDEEERESRSDDESTEEDKEDEIEESRSKKRSDEEDQPEGSEKEERKQRSVELVWTTGAGVVREDPETGEKFIEKLSLDPGCIRMERLNSGRAPLLNSHSTENGLNDVLGVVEKAWLDEGKNEGRAVVRFSKRESASDYLEEVRDGILSNTSVGYTVYRYEDVTQPGDEMKTLLAVDWEPVEISLVVVPADMRSGVRKKLKQEIKARVMPIQERIGNDPVAKERQRILEITKAVRAAKLPESFGEDLVSRGVGVDHARKVILDEFAKQDPSPKLKPHIQAGELDEKETKRRSIESALLHRLNPTKYKPELNARRYNFNSLLGVAKACSKRSFNSWYEPTNFEIVDSVLSRGALGETSDFPLILSNVVNKILLDSFQSAPATYKPFTRITSARDFKPQWRLRLGEAPDLEPKNENGEFKRSQLKESAEVYAPKTFGREIALTREAIINDSDLNAFNRIPDLMGRAAADHISDSVYGALVSNPMMLSDGTPLFHESHRNEAEKKSRISLEALNAARVAMKTQKGMEGRVLNIIPEFILVPAALEMEAQQYLTQNYLYGIIKADAEQKINPLVGSLQVISEPRLDFHSPHTWYTIASPSQIDVLEMCYLQGAEGPYIASKEDWSTEGIIWRVRLDYGVKFIEWRSIYRNQGVPLLSPDAGSRGTKSERSGGSRA